jgi:hypothetical protein
MCTIGADCVRWKICAEEREVGDPIFPPQALVQFDNVGDGFLTQLDPVVLNSTATMRLQIMLSGITGLPLSAFQITNAKLSSISQPDRVVVDITFLAIESSTTFSNPLVGTYKQSVMARLGEMLATSIDAVFKPKDARLYWDYATLITTLQGSDLHAVTLPTGLAGAYAAVFTVYASNMAQLQSFMVSNQSMAEYQEAYLARVGPFVTTAVATFLNVPPEQVSVVVAQNRSQPVAPCAGADTLIVDAAIAFANTRWCPRKAVDFIIETLRTDPGELFPEMLSTSLDPARVAAQVPQTTQNNSVGFKTGWEQLKPERKTEGGGWVSRPGGSNSTAGGCGELDGRWWNLWGVVPAPWTLLSLVEL